LIQSLRAVFVCFGGRLCRNELIRREYGSFLHNSFLALQKHLTHPPAPPAITPCFQPYFVAFPDQMRRFAGIR
jgi:hypothetical protein